MPFMAALVYLGFLITAIYAISKSSDLLIDIASCLGRKLHLKDYFIGSLIVGVGTSLPELMTSLAAVGEGAAGLVAPTIYGTIIANIGAGLGLAVIGLYCFVSRGGKIRIVDLSSPYGGGAVSLGNMKEDTGNDPFGTPLVFATFSVLLSYLLCLDGIFSRLDAGLFIIGYLAFIVNEFVTRSRTSSLVLAKSEPAAAAIATAESTKEKVVAEGKGLLVSDKATWSIAMGASRILGGPLLAFLVFAVTWAYVPVRPNGDTRPFPTRPARYSRVSGTHVPCLDPAASACLLCPILRNSSSAAFQTSISALSGVYPRRGIFLGCDHCQGCACALRSARNRFQHTCSIGHCCGHIASGHRRCH